MARNGGNNYRKNSIRNRVPHKKAVIDSSGKPINSNMSVEVNNKSSSWWTIFTDILEEILDVLTFESFIKRK